MEGISKFPYFHKFYLMLGQLEERRGRVDAARSAYQNGLKRCMNSVPLWRSLSRLEEQAGMVGKARNVLEQVRRFAASTQHLRASCAYTCTCV